MSSALYLTADRIGTATGGGVVTRNELRALVELGIGDVDVWSFPDVEPPWGADEEAVRRLNANPSYAPTLVHCYSGTFTDAILLLRARGSIVTYTCAAHDIEVSKREHEMMGGSFHYPHLTDPVLWQRYVAGYRVANLVITPSTYSCRIMKSYGVRHVDVIPHGVDLPSKLAPLPERFSVAYLGQPGPDKGVGYLLDAWERLGFRDALLTIAGRNTEGLLPLARIASAGLVHLRGEVDDPSEIYNGCVLYVQPSASEGFGIGVIEAMAHGRLVVCSDGAGAHEHVVRTFPARDAGALARAIEAVRHLYEHGRGAFLARQRAFDVARLDGVERARDLAWPNIRARYIETWRDLLATTPASRPCSS